MAEWRVVKDSRGEYKMVYDQDHKPSQRALETRPIEVEGINVRIHHSRRSRRQPSDGEIRRYKTWPARESERFEERGRSREPRRSRSRERHNPKYSAPPAVPEAPLYATEHSRKKRVHWAEDGTEPELLDDEDWPSSPVVSDDPRAARLRERLSRRRTPQYPYESSAAAEARWEDEDISRRFDELKLQTLDYIASQRSRNLQPGDRYHDEERRGRSRR